VRGTAPRGMVFHAATWIDELTLFTYGGRDGQSQFFDDAKYRTLPILLSRVWARVRAVVQWCVYVCGGANVCGLCVRVFKLLTTVLSFWVGQWCCPSRRW
jgi:hypothetical protein